MSENLASNGAILCVFFFYFLFFFILNNNPNDDVVERNLKWIHLNDAVFRI